MTKKRYLNRNFSCKPRKPIIKRMYLKHNFSCKAALLTDKDSKSAPSDVSSLTSKSGPGQNIRSLVDTTPLTADSLDSRTKFEEAVHKDGFPEGRENAHRFYKIVEEIINERSNKLNQYIKEVETDHNKDMKDLDNEYNLGRISKYEYNKKKEEEIAEYNQQIQEHNDVSEKEFKDLNYAIADYKKDYDIPSQDSSHIDYSTDMPAPTDDE